MASKNLSSLEWLEADGLGGYASGTAGGVRTRRYHALLLVATTPPTGRKILVNGFDAWVETSAGTFAISSQYYAPGVLHPDGARRIKSFKSDAWPCWTYQLEDGTRVIQEILVPKATPMAVLSWRLEKPAAGVRLCVRPFLSGRDYHHLHRENPFFSFEAEIKNGRVAWQPYPDVPGVVSLSNAEYIHQPDWYRNFLYTEERLRGLDCTEDLATPGMLRWDLSGGQAHWLLTTKQFEPKAARHFTALQTAERNRRKKMQRRLQLAADAYIVRRGKGKTIVAGYPWFTDWGRDTFVALRGLCLATRRWADAREILLEWADTVSEGMLPNRFLDQGDAPEFNTVDASLWYVIAVHELLQTAEKNRGKMAASAKKRLYQAVEAILRGYAKGTRYGIHLDEDGLLRCGIPGVQLTWMDAKTGDWVVTPRIGKPVEVQALWLNALWVAQNIDARWAAPFTRGKKAFQSRFWNPAGRCLYDVVDADHQAGKVDALFRPNQIFAVGGLPLALWKGKEARNIVDAVEARLWTPLGLRSLASGEPGYRGIYEGTAWERDGAYHQGTVWPWLLGAFVEAWVRVRGETKKAKSEARKKFLTPIWKHLEEAGLGHVSEIADGDAPHTPRGCPFQAWSVGEILRLDRDVLR